MPLKLKLRPNERLILGSVLLRNGDSPCQFTIENRVPILREKDILTEQMADTPCKRLYFLLQVMYLEQKRSKVLYDSFLEQVKELIRAAPSLVDLLYDISEAVLDDNYYTGLKIARQLIDREELLMRPARVGGRPVAKNSSEPES